SSPPLVVGVGVAGVSVPPTFPLHTPRTPSHPFFRKSLEIIQQLYIIFSQVEHIIVNEGKGVNKEGKDEYIIVG
ncbi:hypothetical protein, partial [Frisingicoccus sp.]|uniref:hypothetical protein n=1 Tax=Frisingicoccus sp. TaxID=1918627 RepID=UPI002A823B11